MLIVSVLWHDVVAIDLYEALMLRLAVVQFAMDVMDRVLMRFV